MCGFIARLVEHRTGIAEVTGSNPVETLIFSGFFFPIASIGKFTAMVILYFDLQAQFEYMNYFIYTSHHINRAILANLKCKPLKLGRLKVLQEIHL